MSAWSILFCVSLFVIALFLIMLILVQRGRGGGLSGALGGMGGQSAFGTKAGDFFTRVTIVAATVWILLCLSAILVLNPQTRPQPTGTNRGDSDYSTAPTSPGGATGTPAERKQD